MDGAALSMEPPRLGPGHGSGDIHLVLPLSIKNNYSSLSATESRRTTARRPAEFMVVDVVELPPEGVPTGDKPAPNSIFRVHRAATDPDRMHDMAVETVLMSSSDDESSTSSRSESSSSTSSSSRF
jgi:hypothetical protein